MALAPILYGALLAVTAIYLLFVRKRLDFTSYLFAFFFLYHGPAFFQYHADRGYPEEYGMIAAALALAVVAFGVGHAWMDAVLDHRPLRQDWFRQPLQDVPSLNKVIAVAVACISLIAVMNLCFFGAGARIAQGLSLTQLDIVTGEYSRLRRESVTTESAGVWAVAFTYLCRCGPGPFFSLLLVARARYCPQPGRVVVAALFTLLIFLSRASSLAKSDAVYFIGQVALVWTLASPQMRRLNWRPFATAGVVLSGLFFAYSRFTAADGAWHVLELIYYRVTEIPNLCLSMHFEVYPAVIDHTYGMNIRLLHSLLSWGDAYVPAHALLDESGGNANTIFIADAWVDFGWVGVAAASAIAGAVIGWAEWLVRQQRNTVNVALFGALLFPVHSLISTSLVTCLFGFGLLTLPLMCLVIRRKSGTVARLTDGAAMRVPNVSKVSYAAA